MIDDGDLIGEGPVGREVVFEREREVRRRYSAPYRSDRIGDRADDAVDALENERERGYRAGRRGVRRDERRAAEVEAVEDERERRVLFGGGGFGLAGGFGMGGSGAALVIIGLLLMAIAYFGLGFDGGGYGGGYAPYDSGGGYTPELPPQGLGDVYGGGGGGDLLSQRPMMFMGGGFLFMTGWLLVIASRLRSLLTDDL